MKYDSKSIKDDKNLHKIVWACAYKHTSFKTEKHFYCKPIKGMLTTTQHNEERERYNLNHYKLNYPTYFVPFRKDATELTLENLAWSKAVRLTARRYADTEAESIEQYNELVLSAIKELFPIIQKDANEVIFDNLTNNQQEIINAIKSITI